MRNGKIWSDEYSAAWKEVLECTKIACKYDIGHPRREYWLAQAEKAKKIRDEIKARGEHTA